MSSFDTDKPCKKLAIYLMEQLNDTDARQVVASISDYYVFVGGEVPFDPPLLSVFRGNRSGRNLEISELNIGYYLFDLEAYRQQPGILTGVEDRIVQLLKPYDSIDKCIELNFEGFRSRRGYLPYGGLLLPNTVLSLTFTDFEGL